MGWKFGLLREKERIGQPSKRFNERSNTLIYSGSVTIDLHALPWPSKSKISPIFTKQVKANHFHLTITRWVIPSSNPLQPSVFPHTSTLTRVTREYVTIDH